MNRYEIQVVVLLNTADESEVPLEIAHRIDQADLPDISQTVCSFYPPATETFDLEVLSLDDTNRLDPTAYRTLWSLLKDADLLHVHPNAVGAIARLMAAVMGVPSITTEHNTHTDFGRLKRLVIGSTNWLSDAVICVSNAVRESFSRWEQTILNAAGVETVVIHNGVDIETVQAGADRAPPVSLPSGFLIGGGGRMVPQKNLSVLLEAVAPVMHDTPDVHLVLTGDGPLRTALERQATELGIIDNVLFTGFLQKRRDIHTILHRLDVFAMPSKHEGHPMAALEAMAAGLPVLAADIPPLRELLGESGVFVSPNGSQGFTQAIRTLLDEGYRAELATKAQARAEEFPIDQTVSEHIALYRRVASSRL